MIFGISAALVLPLPASNNFFLPDHVSIDHVFADHVSYFPISTHHVFAWYYFPPCKNFPNGAVRFAPPWDKGGKKGMFNVGFAEVFHMFENESGPAFLEKSGQLIGVASRVQIGSSVQCPLLDVVCRFRDSVCADMLICYPKHPKPSLACFLSLHPKHASVLGVAVKHASKSFFLPASHSPRSFLFLSQIWRTIVIAWSKIFGQFDGQRLVSP